MCVIIDKPAGIDFDRDDLLLAYQNNPHGFGFMFYDEQSGRIFARKSNDWTDESIADWMAQQTDKHLVVHYRYKTKGEIKDSQCHPFKILDKKRNGMDMYFMHNGTISHVEIKGKESDTQAFNRHFLQPILRKNPLIVETEAFKTLIEKFIGWSRLVIMYDNGKIIKFNEDKGDELHGCWVSNDYSFKDGYRYPKKSNTTYPTYGANGYQGGNYSNTTNGSFEKGTLVGQPIAVGDKVNLWSEDHPAFFTQGKIEEIRQSLIFVRFKDEKNQEKRLSFWKDDGNSPYSQTTKYYVAPSTSMSPEESEDKKKETKEDTEDKDTSKTVSTKEVSEESKIIQIEDKRKEKEEQEQEIEEHDPEFDDYLEHAGVSVDDLDRYGGGFLEASKAVYGHFSFEDIYQMTPQERLEFFIDNSDIAFNMFQDLVEFISLEDDYYYGYYDSEVHYEDDNDTATN